VVQSQRLHPLGPRGRTPPVPHAVAPVPPPPPAFRTRESCGGSSVVPDTSKPVPDRSDSELPSGVPRLLEKGLETHFVDFPSGSVTNCFAPNSSVRLRHAHSPSRACEWAPWRARSRCRCPARRRRAAPSRRRFAAAAAARTEWEPPAPLWAAQWAEQRETRGVAAVSRRLPEARHHHQTQVRGSS
jgi:hypothetical protein